MFQSSVAESALSAEWGVTVEERISHVPCEGVWLALLQALFVGPSAVRWSLNIKIGGDFKLELTR